MIWKKAMGKLVLSTGKDTEIISRRNLKNLKQQKQKQAAMVISSQDTTCMII